MIVCVSANPGLDRRIRLRSLALGEVNRALSSEPMPGGKAAHVALAVRALGAPTAWLGFLGASIGEQLGAELRLAGIEVLPVQTQAPTRVNLELIEDSGRITEVLEPGAPPTSDELEQFLAILEKLLRGAWKGALLVIAGSLPAGVPEGLYSRLIRIAQSAGSKVFLDTSGNALETGLKAGPDLVKPNRREVEALFGKTLHGPDDALMAGKQLIAQGAKSAVVTLGGQGLVWVESQDGPLWIARPPKLRAISTVGCGDVTLAGFAYAASVGWSGEKAVRFATACGAANCSAQRAGAISAGTVADLMPRIEIQSSTRPPS